MKHIVRRLRHAGRAAALLAAVGAVLLSSTVAATIGGAWVSASSLGPDRPAAWTLLDGFEDPDWPDPGLWTVPAGGLSTWRTSACEARSGSRSLRAFGGSPAQAERPCSAPVSAGEVVTATMTLDLRAASGATRLDLFFDAWLDLHPAEHAGLFVYLRQPVDGGAWRLVPVFGATAQSGTWVFPMRHLDLMNLDDIVSPGSPIDLRGAIWQLQWAAYAQAGAGSGGGVFVDNVSLVWEPDPAVPTPTVRPSATATLTPSPSPTRRATPTSTPTATPRVSSLYLPVLQYPPRIASLRYSAYLPSCALSGPPLPTSTATASATEPTPVDGTAGTPETPGTARTPEATGTPTVSATPAATPTFTQFGRARAGP